MFRIASVFLFVAYIFLLRHVSVSQLGPDWEIPLRVYREGIMMLVYGLLSIILSCGFVLKSRKSLIRCKRYAKVIYTCLLIIAIVLIILGFNGIFFSLPVKNPVLSISMEYIFWPGIIISFVLLLIQLFGSNRGAE